MLPEGNIDQGWTWLDQASAAGCANLKQRVTGQELPVTVARYYIAAAHA